MRRYVFLFPPFDVLVLIIQDALIQRHLLWKLYHITQEIEESTRKVEEVNEKLAESRSAVVS